MAPESRRPTQADTVHYQQHEADIYDLEYAWKDDDVNYWIALAKEYVPENGTALELGCGTGRILLPMAENAIHVVGVDQSDFMLAKAKRKIDLAPEFVQERVGLLEADMRTLDLEQKFNLIYIPFNTFLMMRTIPDQLAVFDVAKRHLAPGGVFGLDIFVPDVSRLARTSSIPWTLGVDQTLGEEGIRFQREEARSVDPILQQISVTFRMKEYKDRLLVREWLSDLNITYIFPRELEHLVARTGFEFVHFWGDFDRTDFIKLQEPAKQLPVLRVAAT